LAFVGFQDPHPPGTGSAPGSGQGHSPDSPVAPVAHPPDQAIGFQAIHQLGHVRADTVAVLGQLAQGQGLGGLRQDPEDPDLGQRQTLGR
jgi:hypothetical protein